jgi:hypothetical protein
MKLNDEWDSFCHVTATGARWDQGWAGYERLHLQSVLMRLKKILNATGVFLCGCTRVPTLSNKNSKSKHLSSSMIMLWIMTQYFMMLSRVFLSLKTIWTPDNGKPILQNPKSSLMSFHHAYFVFANWVCFFVWGFWIVFTNVALAG